MSDGFTPTCSRIRTQTSVLNQKNKTACFFVCFLDNVISLLLIFKLKPQLQPAHHPSFTQALNHYVHSPRKLPIILNILSGGTLFLLWLKLIKGRNRKKNMLFLHNCLSQKKKKGSQGWKSAVLAVICLNYLWLVAWLMERDNTLPGKIMQAQERLPLTLPKGHLSSRLTTAFDQKRKTHKRL